MYLQFFGFLFFLINFKTGTIFIGQGLEHSIDMEMVDLSTYVPHISNLQLDNDFIQHHDSGRIMAT